MKARGITSRLGEERVTIVAVRRSLRHVPAAVHAHHLAGNVAVWCQKTPRDKLKADISADVHVKRVFRRLGLVEDEVNKDMVNMVIYMARELYPEYPGIFDFALWDLGQRVCRPHNPRCDQCYLADLCAYFAEHRSKEISRLGL